MRFKRPDSRCASEMRKLETNCEVDLLAARGKWWERESVLSTNNTVGCCARETSGIRVRGDETCISISSGG